MRTFLVIACAALALAAAGCERVVPPTDAEAHYHKDIDGPVDPYRQPPNTELLSDQKDVAEKMGGVSAVGAGGAGGPAAGGNAAREVQAVVGQIRSAVDANQPEQVIALMVPADAAVVQGVQQKLQGVQQRLQALTEPVRTKLGEQAAAKLAEVALLVPDPSEGAMPLTEGLGQLDPAPLKYARQGNVVLVTGPDELELSFVQTRRGWRLQLGKEGQESLAAFDELMTAYDKALTEIQAGIDGGSITRDNYEAHFTAIADKHLAQTKFVQEMKEATEQRGGSMGAPGGPAGPGGPPAPAP